MKKRLLFTYLLLTVFSFCWKTNAQTIHYVNLNATGANDGTSWVNAYTNINGALAVANTNNQIWIAAGTYKPANANRGVAYDVNTTAVKIYGGFAGTETQLSQRNHITNQTIISGDLQGNDNGILTYSNSTRSDNSTRLMWIRSNDVLIDGITFTGAEANSNPRLYGVAITKATPVTKLTIKNCTFFRNIARDRGGAIYAPFNQANSELNIENCIFEENLSRNGAGINTVMDNSSTAGTWVVNTSNSLFIRNKTQNIDGDLGGAGSSAYIVDNKGTSFTVNWTNNTHYGNKDLGTFYSFTNSINHRTTLGIGGAGQNAFSNISNCIFWDNVFFNNFNSTNQTAYGMGYLNRPVPFSTILNSGDNRNFAQSPGTKTNIRTDNPQFINSTNNNFGLSLTSQYIDAGDNTNVVGSTDILGNPRIANTTVDIGAYENQQPLPPPCFVNIPDANFKAELLNNSTINTNNNKEIECSEATAFTGAIDVSSKNISDVTGIEAFVNVTDFRCFSNQLTSIDVSQNTALIVLACSFNQITSVDVSQNTNLERLYVQNNNLSSLNVKNGANTSITNFDARNNANLSCIGVDNVVYSTTNWINIDSQTSFNTNCNTSTYTLTLNATNGTVATNPNPTNGSYANGTTVTLTATPNTGYQFDGWSGDASGTTNPLSITMNANKTVTALFSTCVVNIPDTNFKTALINNQNINTNGNSEIECTEANAYTGSINVFGQGITDLTGIEAFTKITNLNCFNNTISSLNISQNTDLVTLVCYNNNLTSLDVSQNLALTRIDVLNNNLTSLDVTQNTNLEIINVRDNDLSSLDMRNGNNTLISGSNFDARNNPNLTCISVDDVNYSTTNWTNIDSQTSFNTNCNASTYTLTLNATNGIVTTNPNPTNGSYANGTTVTLTATPNAGYQFDGWSGDASGTTNPLSITMNTNKTVTALFSKIQRTLTINATNGTVTTNPNPTNGTYDDGTTVTLTATPNNGYTFVNWSGDLTSTNATVTIAMNANKTVTANFTQNNACTNTVNILDVNFKNALLAHGATQPVNGVQPITGSGISVIDTDGDGEICTTEASAYSGAIRVIGKNISDLTGIEAFTNITELVCHSNQLTTLNVTQNTALTALGCAQNQLTSLDVSQNTTLRALNVNTNQITSLDLSQNTSLTALNASVNQLTSLNVTQNTALEELDCVVNQITSLDLSQNIALNRVICRDNQLISLDIRNGNNTNINIAFDARSNPNLTCISVDDVNYSTTNWTNIDTQTSFSTNCSADTTPPTVVTQNITVQLDANGNATITPQQINNGSTDNIDAIADLTFALNKTTFDCSNIGVNTVMLTVTDTSNNSANATATVTVEDVMQPTVVTQNITAQLDPNGNATITPQQIDNGSSDNCSIASMSLDKTIFNCSNIGANQVVLTVVDANGNSNTATATVTVEDSIAPTAVAQDISVQLGTNNQVTITPAQINNGSSDNCTSATNLTYSLDTTTFSCSEVGTNDVVLTVTDASGNQSTANAVVTVSPNPNAQLATVAQNITVQLDANGSVTIQPSDVDNGSGSGCNSNPTLSLDKTTFDCSNIGANTVILTATDGGVTETATATVTVEDTMVPTVNTKDVTVTLSNGQGSITVADIDDNSTDNCSVASTSLDTTSFTCADLGANTVTLTVTDGQGNVATKTATITVVETAAPVVVTQNISVALDANGTATITPQQVDNGSSDDCSGIASMSLDTTSFQCPDVSAPQTVTLTVTDNSGNTATGTATVTFTAPDEDNDGISDACDTREVLTPKGFSPNGDGQNDTWTIENIEKFPNSTLEVFNRWGEKVYQANNYQNNWDGTSNQKGGSSTKLPAGAYYYIINLNDSEFAPVQGWLYINY